MTIPRVFTVEFMPGIDVSSGCETNRCNRVLLIPSVKNLSPRCFILRGLRANSGPPQVNDSEDTFFFPYICANDEAARFSMSPSDPSVQKSPET